MATIKRLNNMDSHEKSDKSFTGAIIAEIWQKIPFMKENIMTCGYGALFFAKSFDATSISIQTKSKTKNDIYQYLIKRIFGITPWQEKLTLSSRESIYISKIMEPEAKIKILTFLGNIDQCDCINTSLLKNDVAVGTFLAGAFLVCGSITSPEKGYRAEFTIKNQKKANGLLLLLKDNGFHFKVANRNASTVLYTTDSSVIEDFLIFIGAQNCSMEIMEVKIIKDLRNSVNRQTNCEMANISKTVSAAEKQLESIYKIQEQKGLEWLPDDLREVARLRILHNEMSLKELGENLKTPISRSGVNHRLERLIKIASEL